MFWKPVYYLLEEVVECWLLNAQHLKKVPGRKTDVSDSEWIAELVAHGLVRPSFVPPMPIRRLRDLTRYRTALTQERTREIQRLQNLLEDAGIKLDCVVSDITGMSARRMLSALIHGERDPQVLAELALGRMRPKIPDLQQANRSSVMRPSTTAAEMCAVSPRVGHRSRPRLGRAGLRRAAGWAGRTRCGWPLVAARDADTQECAGRSESSRRGPTCSERPLHP